jgi:hypothetical protein
MINIQQYPEGYILDSENVCLTYSEASETPRELATERLYNSNSELDWDVNHNHFGEFIIVPYGLNNNLPSIIKDVVQHNYMAPGLLKRKTELLWGSGPSLYTSEIEGNKEIRKLVKSPTITKWLESWDYQKYLTKAAVDYNHVQGFFTEFVQNKGYRIEKPFIKRLAHLPIDKCRLAYKAIMQPIDRTASHVIITDWEFRNIASIVDAKERPIFEPNNPFKHPISVYYSNMYTFCTDYYSVPDIFGSLEWLRRSTAVPLIFKALSKNSLNVKYHLESPGKFWQSIQDKLKANAIQRGLQYQDSMLEEYKHEFLTQLAKVFSSDINAGKFMHTIKEVEVMGMNIVEHGWTIKPIDQNIKDFVDAQIKISERADYAVSTGISLHSALGNVGKDGVKGSGSEQLYSLINYLNTGVDLPEMHVCNPINYAIRANFDENIKIGFMHNVPEKQKDVNPSDRSINNAEINK